MPRRDPWSRQHELHEAARRDRHNAKAARRARVTMPDASTTIIIMPDASTTIFCRDQAHERFHRLLRGSEWVCTICGPAPSDS
jgi:hypothetical protein